MTTRRDANTATPRLRTSEDWIECFNSPYGCEYFKEYAESVPQKTGDPGLEAGESCKSLSEAARSNKVFIVGGSVPEKHKELFYNTSMSFGPDGELLGIFRKIHLADINIPGRHCLKESDVLSPGNQILTIETNL